ncbi:MAG TPA: AbrB/MazE/SpoVT family DNA-binding domain-containing protein [Thermoanaerobaculia bacterium]|jgi:AbrB family looped-hinge helix DNA binding protein|nr:AbrB/MazE/SpoVT family DNA-binding domain-containing protein [Thermoanaerobaculia bacterium]
MAEVTVSAEFKVEIPEEIREALKIRPGAKLEVFKLGNRIELVPVRPIQEMRGFLKGIDTTLDRDRDRS